MNESTYFNYSSPTNEGMAQLFLHINKFGIPLIVLIGLVGNTLSFLVFVLTPLRYKSSSVYLAFMNVADTGFLISLVPAWLGWVHVDIFHSQGWCQVTVFATYVFGFLSVWVVVSFTVERYIVVFHPLRRSSVCTVKKAVYTMTALTITSLLFYSYNTWTVGIVHVDEMPVCQAKPEAMKTVIIMSGIDTVITLFIPSILVIIFNTCIIIKLYIYHKKRVNMRLDQPRHIKRARRNSPETQGTDIDEKCALNGAIVLTEMKNGNLRATSIATRGSLTHLRDKHSTPHLIGMKHQSQRTRSSVSSIYSCSSISQNQTRNNFQLKTTRSLIIVSSVFLVLNLPSHAFRVSVFLMQLLKRPMSISASTSNIIQEICQLLHYVNFSANFFLYTATSTCFREGLCSLMRRCKHHR